MSASQFPPLQSKPSTKRCTNCSTLMSLYALPGHYGRPVELDVCHDCNAIWFDQSESTQLSPDGTVALFQLINERGGTSTTAASKFGEGLRCVTCGTGMRLVNDRVKNTRFAYQSCPQGHGRLTTFYNFLSEKQFVRELTQLERSKLAATVQQIKCSSCAAPVDISKTDACQYCRAPVSVFDRDAAKKAIDHYLQQRQQQPAASYPGAATGPSYSSSSSDGFGYGGVDLAADILFALGRAATRGIGHAGSRAAPAAVGAGAGTALADSGTAATGGLLESIGSGSGAGLGSAADALPSATDALFGSALSSNLGSDLLPSATDALFGSTSSALGDSASGVFSEMGNLFSSSATSSMADSAAELGGSALEGVGSAALEGVGSAALDGAGDVASAAGEGLVDLVADGVGSLLGALFG
jgi:hypothetical protein